MARINDLLVEVFINKLKELKQTPVGNTDQEKADGLKRDVLTVIKFIKENNHPAVEIDSMEKTYDELISQRISDSLDTEVAISNMFL